MPKVIPLIQPKRKIMPKLNISVTVSNEAVTAINSWRDTQFKEDGKTLKYTSNANLARSILKDALKRILKSSPTVGMQTELDNKDTSDNNIDSILDSSVTD